MNESLIHAAIGRILFVYKDSSMRRLLQMDFGDHFQLVTAHSAEVSTDIPLIIGDVSQLNQVVMNLLLNVSEAIGEAQGGDWYKVMS